MRIVRAIAAMIAVTSPPALADIKRHSSIPESLQGSWSTSSDKCGTDDKSVVVLSAKAYTSAEMACAVAWVSETAAPHGSVYSAHLRCTGQPASLINPIIRPDDAKQISVGLDFSNLRAYQRCVAKE